MIEPAKPPQYALVAYLRGSLGKFVEDLRRGLYPEHGHLAAHVTVLPPRTLIGTETIAVQELLKAAVRFGAFEIDMGDVESFAPATPTIFIQVAKGAHRFRDMHVAFNSGALACDEQWPYMPHLTIVKAPDVALAQSALSTARQHWAGYAGEKTARVEELTFVRETEDGHWVDLGKIALKKA